nr:MAG TPA: protein of unknown function (DUF5320) [Caudoviricetes sp.]
MINEELQQQIERLEQQIKDLKVKLESKVEKEPYEVEVPEDIDDCVYINNIGNIYNLNTFTIVEYEKIYKRGLAFKTREEAKQFDKERELLFKLHKWAEEHNGGWTPNWNDYKEEKWTVMYHNECEEFEIYENYRYREFLKLPYFESEEIAELFIKEFGEEIKEVLC